MDIRPEILDFYAQGQEDERLTSRPSLELIRTRVLLDRYLLAAPGRVLDVGGGSGVHASWLTDKGYDVHLIDPAPLHVEQASARGGFRACIGDARELHEPIRRTTLSFCSDRSTTSSTATTDSGRFARPTV